MSSARFSVVNFNALFVVTCAGVVASRNDSVASTPVRAFAGLSVTFFYKTAGQTRFSAMYKANVAVSAACITTSLTTRITTAKMELERTSASESSDRFFPMGICNAKKWC